MTEEGYIPQVQAELNAWEDRRPGLLSKVSDTLLAPLEGVIEALVPDEIQEAVFLKLDQAMQHLHRVGNRLIDPEKIQHQVAAKTESHGVPLLSADIIARSYWGKGVAWASAEGGLTGAAGWAGLLMDVPALYTIALRTVQQIATCYGYDAASEPEQQYALFLVRTGSSRDGANKLGCIVELKKLEQVLLSRCVQRLGVALTGEAAIRNVAGKVSAELVRRKAMQCLPFIGAAVGASLNAYFIHDVAETAYMSYRRRKVTERLQA